MNAVTLANAEHYVWGDACEGWHLLQDPKLSVIRERVPAGKGEVLHCDGAVEFLVISAPTTRGDRTNVA